MIKKLRIKLILVITGSLVLVFGAVILALNVAVHYNSVQQTEKFIDIIAANDGFSGFVVAQSSVYTETQGSSEPSFGIIDQNSMSFDDLRARRLFYVKTNAAGTIFEADYSMMFDFPESEAWQYVTEALNSGNTSGQIGYFSYGIKEKEYGKILVFAERRVEMGILSELTSLSLVVAGASCVLLLVLSLFLSRWMVAPVKTAFEKQRRFVSDANHELKTPLTIISANVDVLNRKVGESERFGSIRTQLNRMNLLIGHLLTLSKIEDTSGERLFSSFDLSNAMLSTALEFEGRAFEEGREYSYAIAKNIRYTGNEEKLRTLLSILIDNALKHSEKGSTVKIELKIESGRPRLSVYNTGPGIADAERAKIFDRFYRSDLSRARETGGYGLGLSIAKAIVDSHKGKIKVNGEQGAWVEFVVSL